MLYIVTATLNGLAYTQRLIASLVRVSDSTRIRLVIVDNGSTDGTLEWLASLRTEANGQQVPLVPSTIAVIANQHNLGASAAWNQGLRLAIANGAEAVLVCGNDTVPMPGTIERLHDSIKRGVAFITGTAVSYTEPDVAVALAQPEEPFVAAPDFSFFMLTPQAVEIVARFDANHDINAQTKARMDNQPAPPLTMNPWEWGLFDSRYFPAYFEDNDYHTRAHLAGLPCLRDPGALFRHEASQTIRSNPEVAALNEQTFKRNAELFRAKFGRLPSELGLGQARPLNVSEEQWAAMSGGHPVETIDQQEAIKRATDLYTQYGITSQG